jgi:hypothetical protein
MPHGSSVPGGAALLNIYPTIILPSFAIGK